MQSIRNIIAVILTVAGLFLLVLGATILRQTSAATIGAILLVGGLVLGGLYAIADKLARLETRADQGDKSTKTTAKP